MRVLISGGVKTENIVKAIQKKFNSSGVDFVITPYIEDIVNLFQRGEYFDRAIIIEQCWDHDGEVINEFTIREKLNNFSLEMTNVDFGINFVFLTQTKEMASIIYEEAFMIQGRSIIVVKKPTYTVKFFYSLVAEELSNIPKDILYQPEPEVGTIEKIGDAPKSEDNIKGLKDESPDSFMDDDFNSENANRLNIDTGLNIDGNVHREEITQQFGDELPNSNNVVDTPTQHQEYHKEGRLDRNNSVNQSRVETSEPEFNGSQSFRNFNNGFNDGFENPSDSFNDGFENPSDSFNDGFENPENFGDGFENPENFGDSFESPENFGDSFDGDFGGFENQSDGFENSGNGLEGDFGTFENPSEAFKGHSEESRGLFEDNATDSNLNNNTFESNDSKQNSGTDRFIKPKSNNIPNIDSVPSIDSAPNKNAQSSDTFEDSIHLDQGRLIKSGEIPSFGGNNAEVEAPNIDKKPLNVSSFNDIQDGANFGDASFVKDTKESYSEPTQKSGDIQRFDGENPEYWDNQGKERLDSQEEFSGQEDYEYSGEWNNYPENNDYPENSEYPENNGYQQPNYPNEPYNDYGYDEGTNPELDEYYKRPEDTAGFSPDDYDSEDESEYDNTTKNVKPAFEHRAPMTPKQIKSTLDTFAARGNSITVTGCGGCGTSTMALNFANVLCNMGYSVLLVDLDTEHKAQSYISKENYDCLDPESAAVMSAINGSSGINTHIAIVRQGFHLLTMGMASDSRDSKEAIQKDRLSRFLNLAKASHNFVIYDVPFKNAITNLSEVVFNSDNIVMVVDSSNWGVAKTMIDICNIESDDMTETLFNRGQMLFNRYRGLSKVLGKRIKTAQDIEVAMDNKVRQLLGEDPGFYFQSMHICGIVNEDPNFELGWFSSEQYSDTRKGSKIFSDLVINILMKS